jgi:predicted glycogen debranching enzyme
VPPDYLPVLEAIRAFLTQTGDFAFIAENLYGVLTGIIEWHIRGTRYNIHVDEDGLLACGEPGLQLTWMDAKVGDQVVTPRYGKPVEIQALWYNAVCFMQELAESSRDHDAAQRYGAMAFRAKQSFDAAFWNPTADCLYDVVTEDEADGSIRPNQIIAASLSTPIVTGDRAARVVERVERELLTPYGLRTLSPSDPRYRPNCEGSPESRDSAYHQGTVWPWLIGPFIRAYLRVQEGSPEAHEQASRWLKPLADHLLDAGVGQISEIFDGDPPHHARGCIAQAWSVGEVLWALMFSARE